MDAKGWLRCNEPRKLLNAAKGKVTDRQLRLFARALARLRWHKMEPTGREIVLNLERYLDGVEGAPRPASKMPKGSGPGGPGLLAYASKLRDAFDSASIALWSLRVKKEKLLSIL